MSNSYATLPPDRGLATARYDGVFVLFHWTIVVLLVVQYLTKLLPAGAVPGVGERVLNAWHLSVGPTILVLMLLRLAWRLTHPVPPPPADLSPAMRLMSRATHWAFYAVLTVLPVLGWLSASAFGASVSLAGIVPLPKLLGTDHTLGQAIGSAHALLAWVLLCLVALHVAGALYHAVIKRDGVVQRMLPGGQPDR